jgi:hypothetical protein
VRPSGSGLSARPRPVEHQLDDLVEQGIELAVRVDQQHQQIVTGRCPVDAIAAELNGRPLKTLQFMPRSEKFAEAVATTR